MESLVTRRWPAFDVDISNRVGTYHHKIRWATIFRDYRDRSSVTVKDAELGPRMLCVKSSYNADFVESTLQYSKYTD